MYGPRPKHERADVTAETEIPPLPAKENRKKQPEKKDFDNKMKALDVQIEELRQKIRDIG